MTDRVAGNGVELVPFCVKSDEGLFAEIQELSRTAFSRFGSYLETIEHWLESEQAVTLCALKNKRPVGFVIYVYRRLAQQVAGEIIALAVDPSVRRQGIGLLLLERAVDALKSGSRTVGATFIQLHVSQRNTSAQRLFLKSGFAMVDSSDKYPNGDTANRMALALNRKST